MALFSTAQLNQLESGKFQIVDLVDITFWNSSSNSYDTGATLRLSTLPFDRTFNSNTYYGGLLIEAMAVDSTSEVTRKNVSITISGLTATFVQTIQNNDHSNAPFTLYKVILDEDSQAVGNPVIVYKGKIQTGNFETSPNNSIVTLHGSHTLYDFNRTNDVKSQHENYIAWCKRNRLIGYSNEFKDIDTDITIPWGQKG